MKPQSVLVHLAAGIGNLVLATPLLRALHELGCTVDLRLDADYPAAAGLFRSWCLVRRIGESAFPARLETYDLLVPAVPPFYWSRFAGLYRRRNNVAVRPSDALFASNEQLWYLQFAVALGFHTGVFPYYELPVVPQETFGVTAETIVLAPGCKTGIMAAKRWPYFPELAARFPDVAVVGTADDIPSQPFPPHVRSFIGSIGLVETAQLLASAGLVVANDSGLAHIAGAAGTPLLMLFGPTSEVVLGSFPPHVRVLRLGLPCEPCWNSRRLESCAGAVSCLAGLSVDTVEREIRAMQRVGRNQKAATHHSGRVDFLDS